MGSDMIPESSKLQSTHISTVSREYRRRTGHMPVEVLIKKWGWQWADHVLRKSDNSIADYSRMTSGLL